LKLKYDRLFSDIAFNCKLRPCNVVTNWHAEFHKWLPRLTSDDPASSAGLTLDSVFALGHDEPNNPEEKKKKRAETIAAWHASTHGVLVLTFDLFCTYANPKPPGARTKGRPPGAAAAAAEAEATAAAKAEAAGAAQALAAAEAELAEAVKAVERVERTAAAGAAIAATRPRDGAKTSAEVDAWKDVDRFTEQAAKVAAAAKARVAAATEARAAAAAAAAATVEVGRCRLNSAYTRVFTVKQLTPRLLSALETKR